MEKTSRRNLLRAVAAGGAAAAGLGVALRSTLSAEAASDGEHVHAETRPLSGPLANATVSFGHWRTDPPLDRFPNVIPAPAANVHLLTPYTPTIRAGGAVNFIISGLHNVQVFEPGTKPEDIDVTLLTPMTAPPGLPIINDPDRRVYRGPDPSLLPLDRVEVVNFPLRGLYLVICGFLFHFDDLMYGYVKVK
jgi:hypothetical protein